MLVLYHRFIFKGFFRELSSDRDHLFKDLDSTVTWAHEEAVLKIAKVALANLVGCASLKYLLVLNIALFLMILPTCFPYTVEHRGVPVTVNSISGCDACRMAICLACIPVCAYLAWMRDLNLRNSFVQVRVL